MKATKEEVKSVAITLQLTEEEAVILKSLCGEIAGCEVTRDVYDELDELGIEEDFLLFEGDLRIRSKTDE